MSRILCVGVGPLPTDPSPHHAAPGIRAWQFATALAGAGHTVQLVTFDSPGSCAEPPLPTIQRHLVAQRDLLDGDAVQRIHDDFGPDAVVTAGSYQPTLAATRLQTARPIWIDLPGDLCAEGQLRWAATGQAQVGADYRDVLVRALQRGDAFSAVSIAQRHALLGQLGLCGRLSPEVLGREQVWVIPPCIPPPCAAERCRPPRTIADLSDDTLLVIGCGGFNEWIDEKVIFSGICEAMARESRLHFAASGGAITDHADGPYRRFCQRVERSAFSPRFHLLGWLERPELAGLYRAARLALTLDRRCAEAELGSRNRLLDWATHGLPAITTPTCELAAELCAEQAAWPVSPRSPDALANTLVRLCRDPESIRDRGHKARQLVRKKYTLKATTGSLLRWAEDPGRPVIRNPAEEPWGRESQCRAEKQRISNELKAIRQSRLFRAAARVQDLKGKLRRWAKFRR